MGLLSNKLTTRQLAEELHRTEATVIRWRRLRRGPPFTTIQGRVLYDRAEVQRWLDEQRVDHSRPLAA